MRIEICGGIASGKSTLTNMLGEEGFYTVYENLTEVPFLDEFYSNPDLFTFETEISFLLHHSVEIKKASNCSKPIICDYSFEQDYAYAMNNLNSNGLEIFQAVLNEIQMRIGKPELIIRLQCSTEEKIKRIRNRGRLNELQISEEYLNNTDLMITNRLKDITIPVICVNTEKQDFRKSEIVKDVLLPLIQPYLS